jgi:hypothetical protein
MIGEADVEDTVAATQQPAGGGAAPSLQTYLLKTKTAQVCGASRVFFYLVDSHLTLFCI